jgi:hypothetical protein
MPQPFMHAGGHIPVLESGIRKAIGGVLIPSSTPVHLPFLVGGRRRLISGERQRPLFVSVFTAQTVPPPLEHEGGS